MDTKTGMVVIGGAIAVFLIYKAVRGFQENLNETRANVQGAVDMALAPITTPVNAIAEEVGYALAKAEYLPDYISNQARSLWNGLFDKD